MMRSLHIALRLAGGALCLLCGLLLWHNLTLHFAQIEEVLPGMRTAQVLQDKGTFYTLIAVALAFALLVWWQQPWKAFFSGLQRPFRTGLSVAVFAVSFIPLFWIRFGGAAWLIILLLGAAFLLNLTGLALICFRLGDGLKHPAAPKLVFWPRLQPWLPAVILLGSAVYFTSYCFGRIPHVEDSIAQLLQARIFASGHFTAPIFQPPEFFFFGFMIDMGGWYAQYPPGHPLMLALGVLAGAPHLVNPLLGFASVILFYILLKALEGDRVARWGAWLMALSPYALFMHAGFMNHTTALAASLVGWLGLKKGETGKQPWLILAGLGFGYCAATRPLEGALFALVGGIYLLYAFGGVNLRSFLKAVPYAAGFFIAVTIYFVHNAFTTGHPLTTGYTLTWGGNGLGLGEVNWGPAHTFGYGLVNSFMSISGLNVFLFEIPVPALLGVFFWAVLGPRLTRWDRAFLAAMILVPVGYLFYYFHDYCFGPRYYFVIAPMLIYFSIKGVAAFYDRAVTVLPDRRAALRRTLAWMGAALLAFQLVVALPNRASVYADSYWGTDDGPLIEARRLKLTDAVVFIDHHPWETLQTKLHSLGFIMGDAHRLLFTLTEQGLDEVLASLGVDPDSVWTADIDLADFEARAAAWHDAYRQAGHPPIDPWNMPGNTTYFSNGAVHLDPRDPAPDIILARDLGKHNRALMERYPDRRFYRYAWDDRAQRFRILPIR